MADADLAAVVVAYGGHNLALAAREALLAEGLPSDRIWLVDAASPGGLPAALLAAWPQARVLVMPRNEGFAQALALGIASALAQGPTWIWLQNHDAALRPGALKAMVSALAQDPALAMVAPRRQEGGQEAPALGHYRRALGLVRWSEPLDGDGPQEAEVLSAAGCLLRPQAWQSVGPMDAGCFLYHEDVDWCLRARALGWRLALVPEAWLDHERGVATGARPGQPKPPWVDHLELRNALWLVGRHSQGWRRVSALAFTLAWRLPAKAGRVLWRGPAPRALGWWALWRALAAAWQGERGRPPEAWGPEPATGEEGVG